MPFPLILANSLSSAENVSTIVIADGGRVPLSNPIYEFSVCGPRFIQFHENSYLSTL